MQETEITNLKISTVKMQKDIKYIKEGQDEMKKTFTDSLKRIEKKVDNFINKAPDKFANKAIEIDFNQFKKDASKIYAPYWIVRVIVIITATIGIAIINKILNLI